MAKYVYTEDDVLMKTKEAEQYKNKKGWFGSNKALVLERANSGDKDSDFHGIMRPSGFLCQPFQVWCLNEWYECFVPEHEPTYEERQAEWVEENGLKAGDMVKVIAKWVCDLDDSDGCFNGAGLVEIGKTYQVESIASDFISLRIDQGLVWADYTCLEKVEEPEWKVGDWFRGQDGRLYKIETVSDDHVRGISGGGLEYYAYKEDMLAITKVHFEPFDLSDPEVRRSLRGRWIHGEEENYCIDLCVSVFCLEHDGTWTMEGQNAQYLLDNYTFDNGQPVGKEVADE